MYTEARAVILDFDGTVLRLFANCNLADTSKELHELLERHGLSFPLDADPFYAFSFVKSSVADPELSTELLVEVDKVIAATELRGASNGILIDGFYEFVEFAKEHKIKMGIASNNSPICIKKFLESVSGIDIPVVGRAPGHPELMKPHPYMLEEMCRTMNEDKEHIIFIGDHPRDYQCAMNFGCKFIGLTSTDRKNHRLISAVPGIVTAPDFFALAELLRA